MSEEESECEFDGNEVTPQDDAMFAVCLTYRLITKNIISPTMLAAIAKGLEFDPEDEERLAKNDWLAIEAAKMAVAMDEANASPADIDLVIAKGNEVIAGLAARNKGAGVFMQTLIDYTGELPQ